MGLGAVTSLIVINIIVFLLTLILDRFVDIYVILGLTPAVFLSRPWTIVTSMFLHASMGHILTNMLTLYFFGTFLTELVGERRFFLIYFIGGVIGNLVYLFFPPSRFATAVGASGAIFALGGVLTLLRPMVKVFVFPIPIPIPLWIAVIGGFFIISPGVAWQAHLGGLLFGLAAGYFLRRRERRIY